ncbi:uncharacterized protein LOC131943977 [Physella acuta]|uniref:uncharacterized protein LOC131943977 n=1 Tax=Physella acuta TaxID=109671 RepID=UPI0027DE595A|nr:uncharacterized protein LOC131943977 [Physella acuta]XP_059160384.1 uncharacterized protein LOC131943977 [Physella acuta]
MERHVPYNKQMKIGQQYNAKTWNAVGNSSPESSENTQKTLINIPETRFSFVKTFDELCSSLMLPEEYALKVRTGLIEDNGVTEVFNCLETAHSITVIIRRTFVKEKITYLGSAEDELNSEATHLVNGFDIGNEIIIIENFAAISESEIKKIEDELSEFRKSSKETYDTSSFIKFASVIKFIDKNIQRGIFKDIKRTLHTMSYDHINVNSMLEALELLKAFSEAEEKWRRVEKYTTSHEERKYKIMNNETKNEKILQFPEETFYTLKSLIKCNSMKITGEQRVKTVDSKEAKEFYNDLYKIWVKCSESLEKLKDLLSKEGFKLFVDNNEYRNLKKKIEVLKEQVKNMVFDLNLNYIAEDKLDSIRHGKYNCNAVDLYIEMKTQRLPAGGDVKLVLFGKSGHGKSTLGNRILEKDAFSRPTNDSIRNDSSVIDSRNVYCTDTSEFYDIDSRGKKTLWQKMCKPSSFGNYNALILVLAYGTRLTPYEKDKIGDFKSQFPKETHSKIIIVITRGDNFKNTETVSFTDWLKENPDEYLKDLLHECSNRCVLFDNSTTDKKIRKEQQVLLINYVDSLRPQSFTNNKNTFFESICVELYECLLKMEDNFQTNDEVLKLTYISIFIYNDSNFISYQQDAFNALKQLRDAFKVDNTELPRSEIEKRLKNLKMSLKTLTDEIKKGKPIKAK